ncbi:hypothetical protein L5515_007557 [Caenorhabditis briggsae]|uniref:C2H2-type domain-containing protein n=2 Tax=Caenorhabditis briggsae TaxID=6238 RepID=A0AAE9EYT6_CAEBR|nr:hypothetical protein L5515_007557 [Caenorhabditis briggsae]
MNVTPSCKSGMKFLQFRRITFVKLARSRIVHKIVEKFARMAEEMEHHHLADEMYVDTYLDIKHQQQQPRYPCPYGCNKMIAARTIDYHKNNGCGRRHNETLNHPELKKTFYCCGACYAEFITRPDFFEHLRLEHEVDPEIHNMEFPDRATFDRFKNWLECEGGAHYRHKSGAKRRARGKGIFLACNRSGNVGSDKTSLPERTGPYRLGFSCTAFIHATEHEAGHVTAEVCGDHYGHDARMRIPNVIKYIIAQKQMEGIPNMDIIGFLRHHFMDIANENIYADRIIMIDQEELKSINVGSTRKWIKDGIPRHVEIWEEELLERVGIVWPPSNLGLPQYIANRKPTTAELAIQENWPRPRVFTPKNQRGEGILLPFSIPVAQPTNADVYGQEEEMTEERYMEMEMREYEVDGYVQEGQMIVEEEEGCRVVVTEPYQRQQSIMNKGNELLEEGEGEVEVDNEVVVTTIDPNNETIDDQKAGVEDHQIASPNNEIVIVDGDVDDLDEGLHHHHHSHLQHQHQHRLSHEEDLEDSDQQGPSTEHVGPRFIEASKASTLEQLMEEIESFKITVLKRAENTSTDNLKSLLIRFQTLHNSIMEKEIPENPSTTIFPSRNKYLYRPGKGLEKAEDFSQRGNITLQPIEDDISDDDQLMGSGDTGMNYNRGIWS